MITIETFCRGCKEPVNIPMFDEECDPELVEAFNRVGVSTCEQCRPKPKVVPITRPQPQREFVPRVVTAPHNDP